MSSSAVRRWLCRHGWHVWIAELLDVSEASRTFPYVHEHCVRCPARRYRPGVRVVKR